MTTAAPAPLEATIPLDRVEQELNRQLGGVKETGEAPAQRARMSNLVIYCDSSDQAQAIANEVPDIVAVHPARVLLLVGELAATSGEITASVNVWCRLGADKQRACSEQVILRTGGRSVDRLPFAVRGLLIGDLPLNLWWVPAQPPPLVGALLSDLSDRAQQLIYDSNGWMEPARGVAATAAWLAKFERGPGQGLWRVASDLNWRRLKPWRRLVSQALDPASAPGASSSITEVLVEHGPHAVVQAWELVSWLAARLNWKVQGGRVQPGVEIGWQAIAPHGPLRIRIRRLPEGPSEVRRVRLACKLDGSPGALNIEVQEEQRLAIVPEGIPAAPRTMTVRPQPLADLIARQLSDREADPVFRETMKVAHILAQSLLG